MFKKDGGKERKGGLPSPEKTVAVTKIIFKMFLF
jgi:hypothetical protein